MLTYDDALNLNYYKKTTFTGWMKPIRFLIQRETPEEGDAVFRAWVWPEPYTFSLTDDSKKIDFTAPFTEEGKRQIVDWINKQQEIYSCGEKSSKNS
ncbi:MAG: GNAT family acetyltransferase [Agathobacter sp.]|nr:GNAT family acetyltransferase [Agathobacter sp.]